ISLFYSRYKYTSALGFVFPAFFELIYEFRFYIFLQPFIKHILFVEVHLVENSDGRLIECAYLMQGFVYRSHLVFIAGVRHIHYMQQAIGLPYFIQSAFETLYQMVRQFANKAYRIAQ